MSHSPRSQVPLRSRRMDRVEFRLLMLLTFPFFLAVTCLSRLVRDRADPGPGHGPVHGGSVFAEARAAAASAIPFAFMG